MSSINKVFLIGNVGKAPEIRHLPNGSAIATLNLATNERWKNHAGEIQERTDWHTVEFYGAAVDLVGKYVRSGSKICVEGKIRMDSWTDKEGQKRFKTVIKSERVVFLDSKDKGGSNGNAQDQDQEGDAF